MIRNAFAAVAALSVALSTVAAHAQAPVRAGAAAVSAAPLAPISRVARTGAKLSDKSDLAAPLWFILAVIVPATGLGLDALLDLGLIIDNDDESSPS